MHVHSLASHDSSITVIYKHIKVHHKKSLFLIKCYLPVIRKSDFRDSERQEDLPSTGSTPQVEAKAEPETIQSQEPGLFGMTIPHVCMVPSFETYSTAFPGHKQAAGSEVEHLGHELLSYHTLSENCHATSSAACMRNHRAKVEASRNDASWIRLHL